MNSLLLAILLLQVPQNGVVTGVVRGANGTPAAGVRVYAIAASDTADPAAIAPPLESQTQTDVAGRYRLEVSAGRYYIASGSVATPTYYPGIADLAGARVVTVVSAGLVEAVDFSSFVAAPRTTSGVMIVGGTGSISGALRYPDGAPAVGIPVTAVPASTVSGMTLPPRRTPILVQTGVGLPPTPASVPPGVVIISGGPTTSGANGAYSLQNLAPDTYYIAAGFAESPTLYPGVSSPAAAKTFVTTPATSLTSIDFTVPRPPPAFSLSGRVTALGDAPTEGAMIEIRGSPSPSSTVYGLPSGKASAVLFSKPDGRFELNAVRPGSYDIVASFSTIRTETKTVDVVDRPVTGLDFSIPLAMFSGRLVGEDGAAFADPGAFGDAIVTTADNPNILASTILSIGPNGRFGRLLEPGIYRFHVRTLPEEYSIQSITAGGVDLLKEDLKLNGKDPASVEIRVARRTASSERGSQRVEGRILDAATGAPPPAERITFCCRETGPVDQFSAAVKTDGSFEFAAVPPGHYAVGVQARPGKGSLFMVGKDIDINSQQGATGVELVSTNQFGQLAATIASEAGNFPPTEAAVVFTGNGRVRVVANRAADGTYVASLPIGIRYDVSVINLPEGYVVKSVIGSTEVQPPGFSLGTPPPPTPVVITVGK